MKIERETSAELEIEVLACWDHTRRGADGFRWRPRGDLGFDVRVHSFILRSNV